MPLLNGALTELLYLRIIVSCNFLSIPYLTLFTSSKNSNHKPSYDKLNRCTTNKDDCALIYSFNVVMTTFKYRAFACTCRSAHNRRIIYAYFMPTLPYNISKSKALIKNRLAEIIRQTISYLCKKFRASTSKNKAVLGTQRQATF